MCRTANYEPSRERAHETDKGQKHAEFFLHVFQLLVESSVLVLKEALALLGVHPVTEKAGRPCSHKGIDRNGADPDRTHQSIDEVAVRHSAVRTAGYEKGLSD